jgi:N utilization substance protein B
MEENPLPQEAASFARELAQGVVAHKERLDAIIYTHAPDFPVAQLPVIDRNILRLAILELSFQGKVPIKAAINEAVELAKAFGSSSSPKFVNGVLGAVSAALIKGG